MTTNNLAERKLSEVESSSDLGALKAKITLSNLQLLELTSKHEKFLEIISEYNKQGHRCILEGKQEQALVYLEEAEKILEYSASCGKTIDRFIIINTLQNEAAAYQRLWELQKSSDYLEAILYNLTSYLDQSTSVQITCQIRNPKSMPYKIFTSFVQKRLEAITYHLQFSAINSQINKHDVALRSAKKSLEIMENILSELYSYECFSQGKMNKQSLLRVLRDWCRGIKKQKVSQLFKEVIEGYKKVKKTVYNDEMLKAFQHFNIGDVMQIEPIELGIPFPSLQSQIQKTSVIKKALYISISYYTVATELRLYLNNSQINCQKSYLAGTKKSKVYHLIALALALEFVPFATEYLEHIIKSLKNNFQIDLESEDYEKHSKSLLYSQIQTESYILKEDDTYLIEKIENNLQKIKQSDVFPGQSQKHESKVENKNSKSKSKLKKLYKTDSVEKYKVGESKLILNKLKENTKKSSELKLRNNGTKSRKSLKHFKSQTLLKHELRHEKNTNSSQKTKDQTKKHEDKKKPLQKLCDDYTSIRTNKIHEKNDKKKTKKNVSEEHFKKVHCLKSPRLKTRSPNWLKKIKEC